MRWRTETFDRRSGGLVFLTTDGLPNSFADDAAFGNFVQSFRTRIEDDGPAAVTDALPAWLDHFSDRGSGDDMTLVIIHMPTTGERPTDANALAETN